MRRYRRDTGLSLRIVLTLVGLLFLYVPLLLWPVGAVVLVLAVGAQAVWARRESSELAGAPPELRTVVDRLCGLADLAPPRVGVLDADLPNAYTLGRAPNTYTLVVTSGLLRRLSPQELEAVVAHELAHVADRDAFVMTIVSFPPRALRALAVTWWRPLRRNPLLWIVSFYLLPVIVGAWAAAALTTLLLMSFSRYRELVADRGAALLTGRPETLMSALQKLSAGVVEIPSDDLRVAAGLNPLFVVPAAADGSLALDPFVLFPTHPTLEQRLERLAELARTQGAAIPAQAKPLAFAPLPRSPNPRAALAFWLAFFTWPLGWALPSLLGDDSLRLAAYAELFALLTGLGAFVCALQALGRAQRGASGGRLAALSLVVLALPLLVTFVGGTVLALAGA